MTDHTEAGEPPAGETTDRWKRLLPLALGIALTVVALVALDVVLTHVSYRQVHEALLATSPRAVLLAVLFTALSFAAMSLYDVIAVHTIAPGRVRPGMAAAVGAAGYAVSNALGFALLTGGALRYRLYRSAEFDAATIGKILGTSFSALWFSVAVIFGATLIVDPTNVPFFSRLDPTVDLALGAVFIAAVAGLLLYLRGGRRRLRWRGATMPLPSARFAAAQIAVGTVDMLAAAATLFVLMPAGSVSSFFVFALVFVAATVAGIASHAPAGLGAFEATILTALGLGADPQAVAALVVYRLIYTALPLAVAVVAMAGLEIARRARPLTSPVAEAARLAEPLIPRLSAAIVFAGGIVLLVSGSTPSLGPRIETLSHAIPLLIVELSNLGVSFAGVALLVIARGLALRLHRAFLLALALLGAGAVFALVKGLGVEEAAVLGVVALLLLVFRDAFYRRPGGALVPLSWRWMAGVSAVVAAFVWLGLFAYADVDYRNALWWEFAFDADAPRFLRAGLVAVALLLVVAIHLWVNGRPRERRGYDIPAAIPAIVERAEDADANLALLGDKAFLLSPDKDAFVMYRRSGGSLIALGEPVGEPAAADELAWSFRALADRRALRPVFYEVGIARLPLFLDMGLTALKLGEVARVDLSTFDLKGSKRQSLRSALNRAQREGLAFRILPRAEVPPLLPRLRAISDAWLQSKAGSEKGFSLGYFDEAYLQRFDIAVLEEGEDVVAFANLWRGAERHEMSIDLMRHRPDASPAVMETLFVNLMLEAKAEGYRWFNLGAAPLAGLQDRPGASRWNRFGALLYRRGGEFYSFGGLRSFKNKFGPEWTPHYLICPPGLDVAKALVDVTALISRRVRPRP